MIFIEIFYTFCIRAVPGKKVLGVERNMKMGVPPTQQFQETPPTHLILIDFSSTPDAVFPGAALTIKDFFQ